MTPFADAHCFDKEHIGTTVLLKGIGLVALPYKVAAG